MTVSLETTIVGLKKKSRREEGGHWKTGSHWGVVVHGVAKSQT